MDDDQLKEAVLRVLRASSVPLKALDIARKIGGDGYKKSVNRILHQTLKRNGAYIATPEGQNPPLWAATQPSSPPQAGSSHGHYPHSVPSLDASPQVGGNTTPAFSPQVGGCGGITATAHSPQPVPPPNHPQGMGEHRQSPIFGGVPVARTMIQHPPQPPPNHPQATGEYRQPPMSGGVSAASANLNLYSKKEENNGCIVFTPVQNSAANPSSQLHGADHMTSRGSQVTPPPPPPMATIRQSVSVPNKDSNLDTSGRKHPYPNIEEKKLDVNKQDLLACALINNSEPRQPPRANITQPSPSLIPNQSPMVNPPPPGNSAANARPKKRSSVKLAAKFNSPQSSEPTPAPDDNILHNLEALSVAGPDDGAADLGKRILQALEAGPLNEDEIGRAVGRVGLSTWLTKLLGQGRVKREERGGVKTYRKL